ncbi:MAG: fumarate hydratase [Methanocorpusculum sp.]|nr:fumarate hydratase [Methanocorpusculum sp.]
MPSPFFEKVASAVEAAIHDAETELPADVISVLQKAYETETSSVAKGEYENIFANLKIAKERDVPICQDTGLIIVYITLPPEVPYTTELYDAAAEGVRRATVSVPLRPNAVDAVTRKNSGDNCGQGMPSIHIMPGDKFTVTVLPKGAGSENMSQIKMMLPSEVDKIPEFVTEVVRTAGSRPCPPIVVGVGIGGTFDSAPALAKEALLEPIDSMDEFEQSLCDRINELGIGAMGLGGKTTALAVKVKRGACHTASLPVAVNIQCWCCRRKRVEL